jgi:hypothetical protein
MEHIITSKGAKAQWINETVAHLIECEYVTVAGAESVKGWLESAWTRGVLQELALRIALRDAA